MLKAVVDSHIRFAPGGLAASQIVALEEALAYDNPAFASALRRHVPTYRLSARLSSLVVNADGSVLIPRGAGPIVRRVVGDVEFIDARLDVPFTVSFFGFPRPYQLAAAERAARAQQGVVVLPTGAGKTLVALLLTSLVAQKTLFIAPTVDIIDQIREAIQRHFGLEAGVVAEGQCNVQSLTVATPQSAAKHLGALRNQFGLIVLDECHRAAALGVRSVVEAMPARFRIGLTATPDRTDGQGALVQHILGPVITRVANAELEDRGHLLHPRLRQLATSFAFEYATADDWSRLLNALEADEPRTRLVADVAARECTGGTCGIVLTGRVAHAEALAAVLRGLGRRAVAVVGTMPRKARSEALNAARRGEVDVLCATQLADEGLDVPRLSNAFLTWPSKSENRFVQRIGRVLRPHDAKHGAVVHDFVDVRVGVLASQARRRARAFAAVWGTRRAEAA